MKNLIALLILSISIACSSPNKNESLVETNPFLIGKWSGEGGFLDTDLNQEIGNVWIEFEIFDDNSVTGMIGDALIVETKLYAANYGFEISGKLDSKIKDGHELDKDHIYILLVIPENHDRNISSSDANFHLKSNSIFDFDMKVGGVILAREK